MLHTVMAAAFEHMQEAPDIGVDISVGVVERVADAGLRGEMDHALGLLLGEGRFHDLRLRESALMKRKPLRPWSRASRASLRETS